MRRTRPRHHPRNGLVTPYDVLNFRPELVLDFEKEDYQGVFGQHSFSNLITFARASEATYTDANGILQTAASGVPRVGHHVYNGSTWVNGGVLAESEARTNLIPYSNEFSNASWLKSGSPDMGYNVITSPDGTLSGSTVTSTVEASGIGVRYSPVAFTSGNFYTASFYVKYVNERYVSIDLPDSVFSSDDNAVFDLVGGVVVKDGNTSNGGYASIDNVGNGWYRISLTGLSTASSSTGFVASYLNGSSTAYAPFYTEIGSSFAVYGAQLEAASTSSSYIPTSGSFVTRAAETFTIPSAGLPYSSFAMSIQVRGLLTGDTYDIIEWQDDANNYIKLSAGASDFTFAQAESGTADSVTGGSFTSGVNIDFDIASRNVSTLINGAVSGAALTENTTPTALPDLSSTDLSLAKDFMGVISEVRIWANDISDSGLEAATS